MKSPQLKLHERLLKSAKENLKSAKEGGASNKAYINYWARAVKSQQKKIDSLKNKS